MPPQVLRAEFSSHVPVRVSGGAPCFLHALATMWAKRMKTLHSLSGCKFSLIRRSHSISFTRAQGFPKYKIGLGGGTDGKASTVHVGQRGRAARARRGRVICSSGSPCRRLKTPPRVDPCAGPRRGDAGAQARHWHWVHPFALQVRVQVRVPLLPLLRRLLLLRRRLPPLPWPRWPW